MGPHTHMTPEKRQFLQMLLEVSVRKMKWDDDVDADDMDDDDRDIDESEFLVIA